MKELACLRIINVVSIFWGERMMKNRILSNKNDILFYVLLFFGLFDAARNYTLLPIWCGYLKDVAIFLLYILNYKKVKLLNEKMIIIQSCFWFIWGFAGIIYSGGYSVIKIAIGIIKYLEFFMLITLFYNWDSLFNMSIEQALDKYIKGSLCIFIVNIVGYYIPNPICYVGLSNSNMPAGYYGGRVSVGQPPIAAFPMVLACVYLIFCKSADIFKILYLMTGIILATTNTGIIALGACIMIYIGYFIFSKKKIQKKYIICFSILIMLLFLFRKQLFVMFEDQVIMYRQKIIAILMGGKDASMEKRKVNWEFAINTLRTPIQWIFGRGMFGFCIGGQYRYIENTYVSILCTYGVLGLGMFLSYVGNIVYRYIKSFLIERNELYIFGICLVLIYLLHMYTLDNLITYTISFGFAFFYTVVNKATKTFDKCHHPSKENQS